jgi:DNA polymerase kappa
MPEFPLSLRLIGLRVTKLKDLREGEKKGIKRVRLVYLPTGGVTDINLSRKQFFESAGSNQNDSTKRRKTSGELRSEKHGDDETWLGEGPEETPDRFEFGGLVQAGGEDKAGQQCPVCSRTLVVDNQGLNEHIDFCLSREAIREATSSAGLR